MNWLCSGRVMNGLISARLQDVAEARTAPPRSAPASAADRAAKCANSTTGEIHRDGHHLAVREIDHAHDAEDHRQAERHQPVDEAGQQAR